MNPALTSAACLAILTKSSALRLAPPTRAPSMSGCCISSAMLAAVTLPLGGAELLALRLATLRGEVAAQEQALREQFRELVGDLSSILALQGERTGQR